MPQLPLFPIAGPMAGRTDPPTSHAAAARMRKHISKAQEVALAFVRRNPGRTAKELGQIAAAAYGTDPEEMRQKIGRRLNELRLDGRIKREGVRDGCSIWWPT